MQRGREPLLVEQCRESEQLRWKRLLEAKNSTAHFESKHGGGYGCDNAAELHFLIFLTPSASLPEVDPNLVIIA